MKPPLVSFAARGLSLIELMVALTISCFLLLGITQVFVAGKTSYQLQSALSRMQESARFALMDVQRNARMAGYMGAGSDLTRVASGKNFTNHMMINSSTSESWVPRFQRALDVFEAKDNVDGLQPTPGRFSDWTPRLPMELELAQPLKGSDILVVRYFSEYSVPLVGFNPLTGTLLAASDKFPNGEKLGGGIYAVGNHRYADLFWVVSVAGAAISAPYSGQSGNVYQYDPVNSPGLTWEGNREAQYGFRAGERWWNAELHRAIYVAYYVGLGSNGQPVLRKQQFHNNGSLRDDELIEGVESLRILVSVDTSVPADDAPESYQSAAQIYGATSEYDYDGIDRLWRQVRSLQIGMLVRGEEQFSTPRRNNATYTVLDRQMRRPDDRRLREVYQTTVSLRNRVSNSQ